MRQGTSTLPEPTSLAIRVFLHAGMALQPARTVRTYPAPSLIVVTSEHFRDYLGIARTGDSFDNELASLAQAAQNRVAMHLGRPKACSR